MSGRDSGARGEMIALGALKKTGYVLVEKNYRAQRCEIDLIMRDGPTLVFVEVKARSGQGYGLGREAVDARKQAHIVKAAQLYLVKNDSADTPVRFDVVEVDLNTGDTVHIIDAFSA
ncbi:MAG: YraN family protein [Bacillota bacterium]